MAAEIVCTWGPNDEYRLVRTGRIFDSGRIREYVLEAMARDAMGGPRWDRIRIVNDVADQAVALLAGAVERLETDLAEARGAFKSAKSQLTEALARLAELEGAP